MISKIRYSLPHQNIFRLGCFALGPPIDITLWKAPLRKGKLPLVSISALQVEAFSSNSGSGLYLYNSKSGEKEEFIAREPGKVGIYFCGITPYDYSHVGHARSCVAMDVLVRYMKHLDYEVNYVRNFTDIDDKIINRATQVGEGPLALSSRFSTEFLDDLCDLQCILPTHQPRVSDHIDHIISMIQQIMKNGCAYVVEGNVYFSIDKFPNYGCLTKVILKENISGVRVAIDERKHNPNDFVLWKASKPGEPSWNSPWGHGRPGWHIECSAISAHYLTITFDIHAGGRDLIFPHHENEIAQNWAACSESDISYWMHIGTVTMNNLKMSKSDGNFISIREVTRMYHPLALRHFLMSTHYRYPINYSSSQLDASSEAIFYIYQTLQDCRSFISLDHEGSQNESAEWSFEKDEITLDARNCIDKLGNEFKAKMADDLHTSYVLNAILPEALKFVNSSLNQFKKQPSVSMCKFFVAIEKQIMEVLCILGIYRTSYSEVLQQLKDKALMRAGLLEDDVKLFIEERAVARRNKDYPRSDKIRDKLAKKGIALMDVGNDTIWRPCPPVEDGQQTRQVSNQQ